MVKGSRSVSFVFCFVLIVEWICFRWMTWVWTVVGVIYSWMGFFGILLFLYLVHLCSFCTLYIFVCKFKLLSLFDCCCHDYALSIVMATARLVATFGFHGFSILRPKSWTFLFRCSSVPHTPLSSPTHTQTHKIGLPSDAQDPLLNT